MADKEANEAIKPSAKLAEKDIVDIDPARPPMFDEHKELAHSSIVEGEREKQAAELKSRAKATEPEKADA